MVWSRFMPILSPWITGVVPMSVVETLRRLSEARKRGDLSAEEFEARRAKVLATVDEAEPAPVHAAPPPSPVANHDPLFEPGVTLALIALGSALPALLAMLLFNLPLWTGGTIFAACLGAVTLLWFRALNDDGDDAPAQHRQD